ncbi:MAG: hypothetical protein IH595_09165 [Bacteroidales bacterium]|nr:hypothetical protein [Bacteroidales bacterium]
MKKHYNYFLIFISLLFIAALSSCQYDNVVPQPVTPIDTTQVISFATQVQPIFSAQNCTNCHKTGGQSPDLTSGHSYNSIISLNLVDLNNPENSLIYWYPDPADTQHHNWQKYTASQAQIVLQWIKQGALNN